MRHFPTGVTVVTSVREGEPRGVTVSSFASVSVDPPLVLICINREARSYLFISESKVFCVNILAGDQQQLAQRFASKMRQNQFEGVPYDLGATGAAIIGGTVAHLECEVAEEHHAFSSGAWYRVHRARARPLATTTARFTISESGSIDRRNIPARLVRL